jgi:hypothetical protein
LAKVALQFYNQAILAKCRTQHSYINILYSFQSYFRQFPSAN